MKGIKTYLYFPLTHSCDFDVHCTLDYAQFDRVIYIDSTSVALRPLGEMFNCEVPLEWHSGTDCLTHTNMRKHINTHTLTFVSRGQTDNLCGSPLLEHKVDITQQSECMHATNRRLSNQTRVAATTTSDIALVRSLSGRYSRSHERSTDGSSLQCQNTSQVLAQGGWLLLVLYRACK